MNAQTPYLVIADDLSTEADAEAEYTWLLHTAPENTIRIGDDPGTAFIEGANRGAVCLVRFISPGDGLVISETDLAGQRFERRGRSHAYARFFRELRADHRTDHARFIAILAAADHPEELPRIRSNGTADQMTIEVTTAGNRTDTILITPAAIEFRTAPHR